MLRSGMNVKVEYEGTDELRRFRESYLLHILDYVVQDRERIHFNDQKIYAENNKDRITLDNVFELAKKQKKQEHPESEVSEDNSDLDTPDEDADMNDEEKEKKKG